MMTSRNISNLLLFTERTWLVKFHDDRTSRTCLTKSPSFYIGLGWKWHFFDDDDVIIQQQKNWSRIKLDRVVDHIKMHILCENEEFRHTL